MANKNNPNELSFNEQFFWSSFTHPLNELLNPTFGAVQVVHFPERIGIFKASNGTVLYSNEYIKFDITEEKPVLNDGELDSFNKRVNADGKICVLKFTKSAKDEILSQLSSFSSDAKKLLFNTNPYIVYSRCLFRYGKIKSSFDNDYLPLNNGVNGFYPYRSINDFSIFKYENKDGIDTVVLIDDNKDIEVGSKIRPLNGNEYFILSNKGFNNWNAKLNSILNYDILNDGKDPLSVFYENMKEESMDTYIFSVFNDDLPVIANKDANGNYYNIINFTYDKDWTYSFEDDSPSSNDHNLEHEKLSPIYIDGVKVLPVKFSYINSFANESNDNFDKTSFIRIKATAKKKLSDSVFAEQVCHVYIKSYNNDINGEIYKTVNISFINGVSVHIDGYPLSFIDLPTVDSKNVGIIKYENSSKTEKYRNNYKVSSSDNNLTGYTWGNLFDGSNISENVKFEKEFSGVSGLPLLYKGKKYYFNATNNVMYRVDEQPLINNEWKSDIDDNDNLTKIVILEESKIKSERCYNISKVKDKDNEKIRIIKFLQDEDCNITLKVLSFDNISSFNEEISFILKEKCFLYPFSDGILSENDKNIVKFIVYKTNNSNILTKDESFYDKNFYNSTIGSICVLELNLTTGKYKLSETVLPKIDVSESEETATIYIPKTVHTEINNIPFHNGNIGEDGVVDNEDYVFELNSNEFTGHSVVDEFRVNNESEFVALCNCVKAKITWNKKDRIITETVLNDDVLIFLIEDSLKTQIFDDDDLESNNPSSIKVENKYFFSNVKNLFVYDSSTGNITDKTSELTSGETSVVEGGTNILTMFEYEEEGIKYPCILYSYIKTINSTSKEYRIELRELLSNGSVSSNYITRMVDKTNSTSDGTLDRISKLFYSNHIHLPGVQFRTTDVKNTDCCFISWALNESNSNFVSINTLSCGATSKTGFNVTQSLNSIVDCEMVNGVLLASVKTSGGIETFNFGGVHPKY